MTPNQKTGGPAFPGRLPTGFDPRDGDYSEGMSLLDFFAAVAMHRLLDYATTESKIEDLAPKSYELAKKMLAEKRSRESSAAS